MARCIQRVVMVGMASFLLTLNSCSAEQEGLNTLAAQGSFATDSISWRGDIAEISLQQESFATRSYELRTTAALKDNFPASKTRSIVEKPETVKLRTPNLMLDGLFAMALQEVEQNSVEQISDWSFSTKECHCFETGRKWNYVWTRDTSYAVDLGLGMLDPLRSLQSLLFKVSNYRLGNEPSKTIVQDTGSGGSWPVSSDRVVWALGADSLLDHLQGKERRRFLNLVFEALSQTLEEDRVSVFDSRDGLYTGEQSFLDWREQSYPSWTAQKIQAIAQAKSLSTNVLHFAALKQASSAARELGQTERADKYEGWARDLRRAINAEFWLESEGMYSAMKMGILGDAPAVKFDLLGQALAILTGVASGEQAVRILSNYPHSSAGAPVLWPQQPLVPIYHNRGIWPFVSAYVVRAARVAGHGQVFSHNVQSLLRGAALNLSNMENFEFLTGAHWFDDGAFSGPVVNSQRQLWSVAGFVSVVVDGIFGKETNSEGIRFQPFITGELGEILFGDAWAGGVSLSLLDLPYLGKKLDVHVHVGSSHSPTAMYSAHEVSRMVLDGIEVPSHAFLKGEQLTEKSVLEVYLQAPKAVQAEPNMKLVRVADPTNLTHAEVENIWAPREPAVHKLERTADGAVWINFHGQGEQGVAFNIYRNGERIAEGLTSLAFRDPTAPKEKVSCYTLEAVYISSGNHSHHSEPVCLWPSGGVLDFYADDPRWQSEGQPSKKFEHGRLHFDNWGYPEQWLALPEVLVPMSGTYYVQIQYGNAFGPLNTGVTAAAKKISIYEGDKELSDGVLTMPHLPSWETWGDSTFLPVYLDAGTSYQIKILDHFNMSYLEHFSDYKGAGGQGGAINRVNFHNLKLLFAGPGQLATYK